MVTQTNAAVVRNGSGENWLDFTFILKVKSTVFADKLHVVMKRVMPRFLA